MNEVENINTFDSIKHIDENGNEFWYARDLMALLDYSKWENFNKVIQKAIYACKNSKNNYKEHFPEVRKTLKMPNNASKEIINFKLSCYACYLIAQNADSRKKNVKGEGNANNMHYNMGRDIRNFIRKQGGTMPEYLKTPNKSLKELEKENKIPIGNK